MSAGKTYWRSLGQLADDPRSREFLDREFPEGASELPEGVSRRTMLQLMGASLSLAGLTACRRPVEKIVPYVDAPEDVLPGVPLHYATTMPFGRSGYGLVVESHEGRPTKIEGNPLHPSTGGASNPWIQASILDLYDPDRSQSVRQNGEERSWADFEAAWAVLEGKHLADRGEGLAVISEPFSSPSLDRIAAFFIERFPRMNWAVHEPDSDELVRRGVERAIGQSWDPIYHFDRASVVLALDSDFLLTDPESVRQSKAFADRRRIDGERGTMNRLWSVEAALSLTGANADHRLRLRPGDIAGFVGMLADELRAQGLELNLPEEKAPAVPDVDPTWVRALARDLVEHQGEGILIAGRGQPTALHAAVVVLNAALGNLGQTVTLNKPSFLGQSNLSRLGGLKAPIRFGKISTLLILGGNPLYDGPADFELADALGQVEQTIHLATHYNETSRACTWHLPQSHFLESWGDVRAPSGAISIVQPLVRPLFGGRSMLELLAYMTTGEHQPAYEIVRRIWRRRVFREDFGDVFPWEEDWLRAITDGYWEGSEGANVMDRGTIGPERDRTIFADLRALPHETSDQALDIVFRPSASVYDGRFANNGWLQELPDPITKITWDNAALLSPATAAALGVEHEDVVRVTYEGRELELPAWIVPGQADRTVVLDLGHGREAAGRVGNGRGFNAYTLRTAFAPGFGGLARVEPTGGRYKLAETQHHDEMDALGEEVEAQRAPALIREATLAEFLTDPGFVEKYEIEHPPLESMWQEHAYDEGQQWGMTIDLNSCTGCGTCVIACQSENNIPIVGKKQVAEGREMHWIRVDRYFSGTPDEPEAVFQPIPCMHCENAPCEQVCPVAATVHDSQGLNTMVYNRCIGTRYCANNCPYKVRRFNFFNFTKDTPEVQKMAANPDVTVRSRGVMEKCSFCIQRINRARVDAKLAGRTLVDGDVRTACEQACAASAIRFGDLRDSSSRVAKQKADRRNYALLAELNNKPRTSYMGKLRNPHPDLHSEAGDEHEGH